MASSLILVYIFLWIFLSVDMCVCSEGAHDTTTTTTATATVAYDTTTATTTTATATVAHDTTGTVIKYTCNKNDLKRTNIPTYNTPTHLRNYSKISIQYNWAIVCLIRQKDTQNDARNKALASYLSQYSNQHNFTILFFSEDNITHNELKKWSLQFENVGKVQHIDTSVNAYWINGEKKYGYKWMCKFFTVDLYAHIKDYDYYFRVDSDNVLVPPKYDIFEWVESHDVEYGYVVRKFEPHKPTRSTLPKFVKKYIKNCDLDRQMAIREPPIDDIHVFNFYNNLHLAKVSFFNSAPVRSFLVAANETGLYENRWGDSTIQAYAVRLFMKPWQIQQLPNMSYFHLSHSSALVTSDPQRVTQVPQVFPSGNWTVDAQLTSFEHVKKKVPSHTRKPSDRDIGDKQSVPLNMGGRGTGSGKMKGKGKQLKSGMGGDGEYAFGNKKRGKAIGNKLLE